ncbi:zinc ribbon domain-containing protein [Schaalia suimastitidis]|uniref:zinc ribbon domain-containing protein n=1 Tax=Schaalia suimastitidis TaxID=121163 RepID=UPI0003F5957D|nr:hypothetical protein [Schaalia suimastitidis]
MNVSHADQLQLLELQALDQRESALRHTRDHHPAHATVRELAARADDLKRAIINQSAVRADITREAARIEAEIEKVTARRDRQQGRVDKGEVPLRDISAMQHEIAQMNQRLASLESDQLSAEERLEASDKATSDMKAQMEAITADAEKVKADFLADMADADNELRAVIAKRRELAASLGQALVAEYERSREKNGALAVVEVRNGLVQGIGTDLSPAELDVIRRTPADQLYWTEDTGQIVVRTNG